MIPTRRRESLDDELVDELAPSALDCFGQLYEPSLRHSESSHLMAVRIRHFTAEFRIFLPPLVDGIPPGSAARHGIGKPPGQRHYRLPGRSLRLPGGVGGTQSGVLLRISTAFEVPFFDLIEIISDLFEYRPQIGDSIYSAVESSHEPLGAHRIDRYDYQSFSATLKVRLAAVLNRGSSMVPSVSRTRSGLSMSILRRA